MADFMGARARDSFWDFKVAIDFEISVPLVEVYWEEALILR